MELEKLWNKALWIIIKLYENYAVNMTDNIAQGLNKTKSFNSNNMTPFSPIAINSSEYSSNVFFRFSLLKLFLIFLF